MRTNNRINTLKLILRIKQFLGWFLALLFPFAARGMMDYTEIPMTAALIYWLFCGILLRYILEKRLPYFRVKFNSAGKELILLIVITAASIFFYRTNIDPSAISIRDLFLSALLFGLLNGCFEALVFINIYELAGCRVRLVGFIAAFIFAVLIDILYWNTFMPAPLLKNTALIFVSQGLMFVAGINLYRKTEDLTLWSVLRIVYNMIIVFLGGFGINMFIHI